MAGLEGTQLGSCHILRRIGGGGMGDIYLADQPGLGRQVAIKVVRGESSPIMDDVARAQARQQFLQEAQAVAKLDHPNILPVYEYGEQDGIHYLVMPYIPQGSLADMLVASGHPGGVSLALPLAPALTVHIIAQAAEALQYAHDHGVIHRDVKPQNLLIRLLAPLDTTVAAAPLAPVGIPPSAATPGLSGVDGFHVLLADFGLARFMALLVGRTGTIGTPLYSAPEQYSGYPVPATDQYALAGIAYLLLTRQHVFSGTVVELHHQHLTVMPVPPAHRNPALPPAVDTVLLRALAKGADQRFPSIREFARALHAALAPAITPGYLGWSQGAPTGAPPAQPFPTPASPSSLLMPTPPASVITPYHVAQPMPSGAPLSPTPLSPPDPLVTPPRPMVLTAPRSPAPAPYVTPGGPWRANADAPGAPLPRRMRSYQLPLLKVQLTRAVLLIGLAAVLVLASVSAVAIHLLSSSTPNASHTTHTVLRGTDGTQEQTVSVPGAGSITLSSLPILSGTPRAQGTFSAHTDQANAQATHLANLPAIAPTVPGFTTSGSASANRLATTSRLVLAGAGQTDVGVPAPMDASVAASSQYVVEALDGLVYTVSINGAPSVVREVAAADVFSHVLHEGDVLGQPRALFDQAAGRWLLVFNELAISTAAVTSGYLDLAVSQGASPLGSWYVYQLPGEVPAYADCTWGDSPQLGVSAVSYYLTASIFVCGIKGELKGAVLWDIPKSAISAGGTAAIFQWTGFLRDNRRPISSLSPAVETDATSTEWLVSNDASYIDNGGVSQHLNVWAVVYPPAAASGTRTITLVRASVRLPYPYADPPAAMQPGTAARLATGDARVESTFFAGGHLFAAFTTAVNWNGDNITRSAVYWLDLGPALISHNSLTRPVTAVAGVLQAGIFGFAKGYTFHPSIVADSAGHVVLATVAASPTMGPSMVLGSRKKADPRNSLDAGHEALLLQRGSKAFVAGAWGDYTSLCVLNAGASSPTTIWITGAYTDSSPALWRTGLWEEGVAPT